MVKKILLTASSSLLVLAIVVFSGLFVSAQGNSSEPNSGNGRKNLEEAQQRIEEAKQERRQSLESREARKCEFAKNHLEFHVQRIEAVHEHRSDVYQGIIDRLNVLALRLENNDQDATALRTSIRNLSDLVSDFDADYALYKAEVRDAANNACDGDAALRGIVGRALSAVRTAKADAQQIRQFVDDDLKPTLEEVKAQVQSAEKQTEEVDENASSEDNQNANSEQESEEQ